jgi:hypothetical protein
VRLGRSNLILSSFTYMTNCMSPTGAIDMNVAVCYFLFKCVRTLAALLARRHLSAGMKCFCFKWPSIARGYHPTTFDTPRTVLPGSFSCI